MMTFSPAYRSYVLAALTGVYTLNLVDRGLLSLLLQPIKEDLRLSDTQLGLLTGILFGLFYATLGLPIARWADRGNRVKIASLSIALWGCTVMITLFISTFAQLAAARVAAAIGEAGCKPPTYSLVGDYFPEAGDRARALSIFSTGNVVSSLVAFVVGGWLNQRYGWRLTFFFAGTLGLILAVVVRLTVREPRVANPPKASPQTSFFQIATTLWENKSLFHVTSALVLLYTVGLGLGPWNAAFMMRSHGMSTASLGLAIGLITSVAGVIGILLGGYVASTIFANNERGQMRANAVAVGLVFPLYLLFLLLPSKEESLVAFFPLMVVFNFCLGPTYAILQRLVRDDMRASTMAITMLIANLVGFGVGPQLVGILSDAFASSLGPDSLRYAMACVTLLSLMCAQQFWAAGNRVAGDLHRAAPVSELLWRNQ